MRTEIISLGVVEIWATEAELRAMQDNGMALYWTPGADRPYWASRPNFTYDVAVAEPYDWLEAAGYDAFSDLGPDEEGDLLSLLVCSPWPRQVSLSEMAPQVWYAYYAWEDGSDGWYLGPFRSREDAEAYRDPDEPDATLVRVFRGADPECPRLVSTEWAAAHLGVAERTVRKWGPRWPGAEKVGRDWVIPTDKLDWWHEQCHQPGPKSEAGE